MAHVNDSNSCMDDNLKKKKRSWFFNFIKLYFYKQNNLKLFSLNFALHVLKPDLLNLLIFIFLS